MKFSDKLQLLITKRNWGKIDAAEAFGVRERTIYNWLAGGKIDNFESVDKHCDILMKQTKGRNDV